MALLGAGAGPLLSSSKHESKLDHTSLHSLGDKYWTALSWHLNPKPIDHMPCPYCPLPMHVCLVANKIYFYVENMSITQVSIYHIVL